MKIKTKTCKNTQTFF